VLVVGALAAAGASAAEPPALLKCVKATKEGKTYIGHYTSKECTTASEVETGGKYEREEPEAKMPFAAKGKATTITAAGKVVKCKKIVGSGEILSTQALHETIEFQKCGVNGSTKAPCTTTGSAVGTIKTGLLTGELEYVNPEETQIGLLLFRFGPSWAEFNCGAEAVVLRGALLGSLANTTKGQTISFKVVGGKQEHKIYWDEEEESTKVGTFPLNLFTEPGEKEATLEMAEEDGPKGVAAYQQ
jgi:hypothetical protein